MANEVIIKKFEELLDEFNSDLTTFGSQITNRTGGGAYDLLVRIFTLMIADLYSLLELALKQGFVTTASGQWLDLKAAEVGLSRTAATKTKKEFVLTRTSTVGVLQVQVGDIIQTPVLPNRGQLRFFSILSDDPDEAAAGIAGEFADGVGEITVRFEAEDPGTAYNNIEDILNVDTVTMEIVSGLTGVDGGVVSTGEDIVPGTDTETDEELRARIIGRWTELARGATQTAYINFAKDSNARVYDANAYQPGSGPTDVRIVLSGPPGSRALVLGTKVYPSDNFDNLYTDDGTPTGNPTIASGDDGIHAYIRDRAPLTDFIILATVTETPLNITVKVEIEDGFDESTVKALVETRLKALFIIEKTVTDVEVLKVGETLLISRLRKVVADTDGIADYQFVTPTADTTVAQDEVLTLGTITIQDL